MAAAGGRDAAVPARLIASRRAPTRRPEGGVGPARADLDSGVDWAVAMPSKKQRSKSPEPPWQVILEEIRSQNRATIEAVEASRTVLEQRIERLERETSTRDAALEMAVRELRLDVRQVQGDVKVLQGDVRGLATTVGAIARLEERVTAIEKRLAS
jgi:hypothetical protein